LLKLCAITDDLHHEASMAFIEWSESFSVAVPTFDAQHKQLFRLVDQLHDAMKSGKTRETMGQILGELVKYTKNHFAAEENAMLAASYPEFAAHKAEHDNFTSKVDHFARDFRQGAAGITIELMDFLTDWLKTHILTTDKKYSAALLERVSA
jgi:hemerythrin